MGEMTSDGYGRHEEEETFTHGLKVNIRDVEVWIEDIITDIKNEQIRIGLLDLFNDILQHAHNQKVIDPLTVPLDVWKSVRRKWTPVAFDGAAVEWNACEMCNYVRGINPHTVHKPGSCSSYKLRCPIYTMGYCNSGAQKSRIHPDFWWHRYPYNSSVGRHKHNDEVRCFIKTIDMIIDKIKKRDEIEDQ